MKLLSVPANTKLRPKFGNNNYKQYEVCEKIIDSLDQDFSPIFMEVYKSSNNSERRAKGVTFKLVSTEISRQKRHGNPLAHYEKVLSHFKSELKKFEAIVKDQGLSQYHNAGNQYITLLKKAIRSLALTLK